MALKSLRKHAKLNFCEDCYKKYVALIEPTVKRFLFKPLIDWREVESLVTRMVMMHEGVFKGDEIFIRIDEDSNKFADKVDLKAFKKVKKWSFKWKIDYLKKYEILGVSSYSVLDRARERRNVIHELFDEYSEQDLTLFSVARWITNRLYNAMRFRWKNTISNNLKSNVEKAAQQWLSKNQ